jgi:imidazolonepropionase-like amidohydrolase
MKSIAILLVLLLSNLAFAQPDRNSFMRVSSKIFALTHVRVIDGTGAAAMEDQTVVVTDGKIAAVGTASSTTVPAGAQSLDMTGYTLLPGLVGMHDHMFFPRAARRRSTRTWESAFQDYIWHSE